jgi:hypothetical protein
MKESIRDNLKMIEENLDHFNSHALRFVDKKEIRKYISIWRWYVSHSYFTEKQPKPEGICSNPPLEWLDAQLKGLTVPISRDIGRCIEPVPNSLLETEQAAHRVRNALTGIYRYISEEDMKKNSEAKYKAKVLDKLDLKKRAEYEKARRDKIAAQKNIKTPEQMKKIADEYQKKRDKQRKDARENHERARAESIRRFDEETKRLKRSGNKT